MSVAALRAIRRLRVSPTQKLVLFALADMANDESACWPSVGTLADITGLSHRAVQAATKALIAVGILNAIPAPGRATQYVLIAQGSETTPAADAPPPPQQVHPTPAADAPPPPQQVHPTPAADAPPPPQQMHPTPAADAPPPPQQVHPTPAADAPRSLIEASIGVDIDLTTKTQTLTTARETACVVPLRTLADVGASRSAAPAKPKRARAVSADDPDFAAFWSAYPRRDAKLRAEKAWQSARKIASAADILAGLQAYPFSSNPDYRPLPATWLNDGRWMTRATPPAATMPFPAAADDAWGLLAWVAGHPTDFAQKPLYGVPEPYPAASCQWGMSGALDVMQATGLPRTWRGDLAVLWQWSTDHLCLEDICPAITRQAARMAAQGNPARSLAVFDTTVRSTCRPYAWAPPKSTGIASQRAAG